MTRGDILEPEDVGPSPTLELTALWVALAILWVPIVGCWMGWLIPAPSETRSVLSEKLVG